MIFWMYGKARSAAEVEGVKFSDVARGYLLMRFARLSADKRAIAAARHSYAETDVASALRTTFPDGLYTGKVTSMVAPVETEEPYFPEDEPAFENDEVLAAEGFNAEDLEEEPIEEQDAVDTLMTWKQTRNQIDKEKINRGLATTADIPKMEGSMVIGSLENMSCLGVQCYVCVGPGCPVPLGGLLDDRTTVMFTKDSGRKEAEDWTGQTVFNKRQNVSAAEKHQAAEEEIDQITVCHGSGWGGHDWTGLLWAAVWRWRQNHRRLHATLCIPQVLGWWTLDVAGVWLVKTLRRHEQALKKHGLFVEELTSKPHGFRYGNGAADTSCRRVQLPIFIRGGEMRMGLHVVPGEVPLLISKRFLKSLGARHGLDSNELYLSAVGVKTQMVERPDGSCQMDLLDLEAVPAVNSPEVDVLVVKAEKIPRFQQKLLQAETEEAENESDDDGFEHVGVHCVFKGAERRELQRQVDSALQVKDVEGLIIMEVFSPGRFAELPSGFGFKSMGSFD